MRVIHFPCVFRAITRWLENFQMKLIPLSRGKFTKVDDSDFKWLSQFNWCFLNGYAVRNRLKRDLSQKSTIRMHREIMKTPDGLFTDHKNMDKLDNQRSNLRICTKSQNMLNCGLRSDNTTSFKGIYFHKLNSCFIAQVRQMGKVTYLGSFKTAVEAGYAYDAAVIKIHGEFARTNEK